MTCVDRECELALVAGLREGDTAAFDVVYDTFNRPLFNFLARLSRRPRRRRRPHVGRNLYLSYRRSRLLEESLMPAGSVDDLASHPRCLLGLR